MIVVVALRTSPLSSADDLSETRDGERMALLEDDIVALTSELLELHRRSDLPFACPSCRARRLARVANAKEADLHVYG